MAVETWKPIPGFEGRYEVSDLGNVRSVDRIIVDSNGYTRRRKGRPIRQRTPRCNQGYCRIDISDSHQKVHAVLVHKAVVEAFLGPRPKGQDTRHLNGIKTDNRLENLVYGTRSENIRDCLRHGTHAQAAKTRCPQNHEYTPENTIYIRGGKGRRCRICTEASRRRTYERIKDDRNARLRESRSGINRHVRAQVEAWATSHLRDRRITRQEFAITAWPETAGGEKPSGIAGKQLQRLSQLGLATKHGDDSWSLTEAGKTLMDSSSEEAA
jgi:hypothetical protein